MAKLVINDQVKERSSSIVVREESDFIQFCKINKVTLSEDKLYYEIEVENEEGLTNTSRFYLPKDESRYETKEKFTTAVNIFVRNVANLYRRYAGPAATIEANDYIELIERVIDKITPVLNTKKFYVMMELTENDKGIFTRIAGIVPFADNKNDLVVLKKQKELLKKKNGEGASPNDDNDFMKPTSSAGNGKIPF